MKELIIKIDMFTMPQTAIVKEDNVILETFPFEIHNMYKMIFSIENLEKVTIVGYPMHVKHFAERIKEEELKKYGKNNLIIETQGAKV